ncbi:26S proteasome regulatory subunit [Entophlyctis luteolus]|nr:26S proteasome regulatory subunit [Entophlyctis luteolus]
MSGPRDVTAYLSATKVAASTPADLRPHFDVFEDLYDRKLWHQLTVALNEFVALPHAAPFLVPLYNEFVSDWQNRMNQLSLVQFVARASRTIKDPAASLAFLNKQVVRLKDQPENRDSYVLAAMEAAHIKLVSNDLDGCKDGIDECEKILNDLPAVEPPLLVSALPFLSQKLCLMSLIESVFRRPKEERGRLPFTVIAKDTNVLPSEVEHLVMKALSLGLVKGSIDEIDSCVSITWVQPRVLEVGQIRSIAEKLTAWSGSVKEKVVALENEGGADVSAAAE